MGKDLKTKHAQASRHAAKQAQIDMTCTPTAADRLRRQMKDWRDGKAPYAANRKVKP